MLSTVMRSALAASAISVALIVAVTNQSGVHRAVALPFNAMPHAYEGEFVWWHDGTSQKVRLLLADHAVDLQKGMVLVTGVELYDVAGRWAEIAVTMTIDVSKGSVELRQLPKLEDRAHDSQLPIL